MFDRILIAVDSRADARRLVAGVLPLVEQFQADVGLIHVVQPPLAVAPETALDAIESERNLNDAAVELLDDVRARFPAGVHVHELIEDGRPCDQILHMARDWHADLIVVGDHGRGAVARFVLGSTADSVVRRAPCPVLVIRDRDGSSEQYHNERPAEAVAT